MAKGQKRSNKEPRKPKQASAKPAPAPSLLMRGSLNLRTGK